MSTTTGWWDNVYLSYLQRWYLQWIVACILSAQGFVEFISIYQLMFSQKTFNETDCANTILNTVVSVDTNII